MTAKKNQVATAVVVADAEAVKVAATGKPAARIAIRVTVAEAADALAETLAPWARQVAKLPVMPKDALKADAAAKGRSRFVR